MRKIKNLMNCFIYSFIIILVSQLTTYGVDYDSTIQYVDSEDKALSTNLNTVNEKLTNSTNYTNDDISIEKNDIPIVKESMTTYPIVTVWTNKKTKVYSDMDKKSEVVDTLYQGYKLRIEQIDEKWCRVLSTQTYITTDNISYEKVTKNLNITKWVTCDLNLRSKAKENSKLLKTLKSGSTVVVNDTNDGWSKVTIGNNVGYVKDKYLSKTKYIPPKEKSLGKFKITHYCNCSICCGKYAGMGLTASGAKLQAGITIAVDPKVISYGTKITINGHTYIAQDCGGGVKGNHIDIYCSSHKEALANGTYTVEVFKVNE